MNSQNLLTRVLAFAFGAAHPRPLLLVYKNDHSTTVSAHSPLTLTLPVLERLRRKGPLKTWVSHSRPGTSRALAALTLYQAWMPRAGAISFISLFIPPPLPPPIGLWLFPSALEENQGLKKRSKKLPETSLADHQIERCKEGTLSRKNSLEHPAWWGPERDSVCQWAASEPWMSR